jgi:hypothetical protein
MSNQESNSPFADAPVARATGGKFVSNKAKAVPEPMRKSLSTPMPADHVAASAALQSQEDDDNLADLVADDDDELGRDVASESITDGQRRIPLGQRKPKLAAPDRPGFKRRFINDMGSRLLDAHAGGWKHVLDQFGKPEVRGGGRSSEGAGLKVYLMEIPLKFFDEDQLAKQESLDKVDRDIYAGKLNQEPDDKRYVPTSNPINFRTQRGNGRG